LGDEASSESENFSLGQIISIPYFFHENWQPAIPRGHTITFRIVLELVSKLRLQRWMQSLSTAMIKLRRKTKITKGRRL
jgi:hypothetical protein